MKWWKYFSHSRIKLSSIDVSFTGKEEPIHINLLDVDQIDWSKIKCYKYVHIGAVKLILGPLVRPFLPISSLCAVTDTRHLEFFDTIIGGFMGPFHTGPCFGTIFPKYFINLDDPNIYNLLKAYVLPQGF